MRTKMTIAILSLMITACGANNSTQAPAGSASNPGSSCTPTPHVDGKTIMPLGDSITFGYGDPNGGGYRDLLASDLGSGYVFVGSQTDPSGLHHEGHPGWTIKDENTQHGLYDYIQCWLGESQPSIVLLMIGTNSLAYRQGMSPQENADTSISELTDLIARIHEVSPGSTIYLASIVHPELDMPWTGDESARQPLSDAVSLYDAQIPSLVTAESARGLDIHFVDEASSIANTTQNYFDMIHPSAAGYAEMERAWYAAISQ